VRWRKEGNLEYLGRNDEQVKIRGFRIELGEIEQVLSQVPGISQCCVVARQRQTGAGTDKCLVGYYVLDATHQQASPEQGKQEQARQELTQENIFRHLSRVLPEYCLPAALVVMESFPLTLNGKLDKRALPEADFTESEDYVAPLTEQQAATCTIWQQVLGVDRVGITNDFFQLGGDSILRIRLVSKMKQQGLAVTVRDIFTYRNIKNLLERFDADTTEKEAEYKSFMLISE
jgi:aryl carrier-like protein